MQESLISWAIFDIPTSLTRYEIMKYSNILKTWIGNINQLVTCTNVWRTIRNDWINAKYKHKIPAYTKKVVNIFINPINTNDRIIVTVILANDANLKNKIYFYFIDIGS